MTAIEYQPTGIRKEVRSAVPDVVSPDFVPTKRPKPFVVDPVLPPEREVPQPDRTKEPERAPTTPTKVPVPV